MPAISAPTVADPLVQRLFSMDALRGLALLLGVVLHSLMSLGTIPWVVTDVSRTPAADAIVGWIHMFRVPLFFALAGYFARSALARKGPRGFAADRGKRILLPLVVFWPVAVLPVIVVAIAFALTHPQLPAAPASDDPLAIATPGHLWFLWSLTQFYLVLLAVQWLIPRIVPLAVRERCSAGLGRAFTGPLAPLWAAVPFAVALWLQPTGIVGPATLRPELPASIAFGGAFWVGWCWGGAADALNRIRRHWLARLAVAAVLTIGCLVVGAPSASSWGASPAMLMATLVAYPVAAWLWVYGLVGVAVTYLHRESPVLRYLADASYWVYLTHLGWVCTLQLVMADLAWPWPLKFLVILGGSLAATLLTYQVLVRSTRIGRWLNGRTYPVRQRSERSAATGTAR
ncbi:acyltransferase family protein [Micropruina sonneratiae]|uniref:acyltransferase family protein n=1 Tax=Micropruina sonneratiae TaxID=2986940 RepID=UPI00222737BB|nr:acyltransferase family protein [Micropruina sp. KQZ13P-5]MCW3159238.1 acyltransferase family protein [Micropruina sp. KQZ13P-5]